MTKDDTSDQNGSGNSLPKNITNFAYSIEELLYEADREGLDRNHVADLLERLAEEVRNGHTELPQHRGNWWNETHEETSA